MPAALHAFARARTRVAAVGALTLAGTALAGTSPAVAAPGDNGDVKIHAMGTPFTDQSTNPKVCGFYLDAFNFDTAQGVTWNISPQPARAGGATLTGTLRLAGGTGYTTPLTLPDGQYKLVWNIAGGNGAGKQKVFRVGCAPAPKAGAPLGGVPAGGGGLAQTPGVPQAGAAAGVGLVSVAGVLYVRRLRRRRSDGSA
ncbi:hypothetical protein ACIBCO_01815 [Streptomyces violascens]|uniref:hypothetical protein n=1 Tax=Streptomyces violascens TaxID=67381 RepID=UPI00379821CA